jgi:putative transcriptional regulator
MSKFYDDLKEGLQDILEYKKGKIHLRSESIEIPEPPAQYKPKDIRKIREINNYSQGVFARILNVNIKTVQSWESGQRNPSHAALRLLEIIDKGIYRPNILSKAK